MYLYLLVNIIKMFTCQLNLVVHKIDKCSKLLHGKDKFLILIFRFEVLLVSDVIISHFAFLLLLILLCTVIPIAMVCTWIAQLTFQKSK